MGPRVLQHTKMTPQKGSGPPGLCWSSCKPMLMPCKDCERYAKLKLWRNGTWDARCKTYDLWRTWMCNLIGVGLSLFNIVHKIPWMCLYIYILHIYIILYICTCIYDIYVCFFWRKRSIHPLFWIEIWTIPQCWMCFFMDRSSLSCGPKLVGANPCCSPLEWWWMLGLLGAGGVGVVDSDGSARFQQTHSELMEKINV